MQHWVKNKNVIREQGITIASIFIAFGMVIGFIVEALLPSGGVGSTTTPPNTLLGEEEGIVMIKLMLKNGLKINSKH